MKDFGLNHCKSSPALRCRCSRRGRLAAVQKAGPSFPCRPERRQLENAASSDLPREAGRLGSALAGANGLQTTFRKLPGGNAQRSRAEPEAPRLPMPPTSALAALAGDPRFLPHSAPLSPPAPFHARRPYLSLRHLPENPSSRNPPGPSPRHLKYLSNTIASWKLPFSKVTPPFSFLPHLGRFSAGMRRPQRPSHRSGGKCSVSFLCCDQPGLGALWITLNIRVYFTRQGLGGREQL